MGGKMIGGRRAPRRRKLSGHDPTDPGLGMTRKLPNPLKTRLEEYSNVLYTPF
jgi:hypothetical protein